MLKAGVEKAVPASEIEKIDRKVDIMEEVRELRSQVLEEAWRTLSPGGILIWFLQKNSKIVNKIMYDVIIMGGGPAGSAAAVYTARKKLKTLLITESFGGQSIVSDDIQNWIGEPHI